MRQFLYHSTLSALKHIPIEFTTWPTQESPFTGNLNIEQVRLSIEKISGYILTKSYNNKVPHPSTKDGKCHAIQLQTKQKPSWLAKLIHPSLQNPFLYFSWCTA